MKSKTPNQKERRWLSAVAEYCCIVCRNEGKGVTPASPHHIVEGGKRLGHMHTIPLCFLHHQEGGNHELWVSRHPHKAEFERRYGTEYELLAQVQDVLRDAA